MKKKALVILASILLISSFSACGDEVPGKDDNHSLINYTDTGENSSSINSKTADIEHTSTDSDLVVTSNENTDEEFNSNKKADSKSISSGSSSDKNTSSTVSNTVSTIIYYYDNEENNTDSSDSQASNRENDSDLTSSSDSGIDTSSDTESNSSQPIVDEPDVSGSYTEEDIALYFNGEKIYLGDDLDSVLEIVGEPTFIDNNLTYNYKDFNITFTQSDDSDKAFVESIQITDSGVETEKGITIGTSLEDVVRVYGESTDFVEKDSEYRYYVGNKYMCFYAPNGLVGGIDYRIDYSVDN